MRFPTVDHAPGLVRRRWPLQVLGEGGLALVAPHGVQRIAGVSAEVEAFLREIAPDTELECEGVGGNILNVVVDRIVGPFHVLEPLLDRLPDDWVRSDGKLAAVRAKRSIDKGIDATEDLRAAMALRAKGIEVLMAKLDAPSRAPLLRDYSFWTFHQPGTPEVLRFVPVDQWSERHLASALEILIATGVFADVPPRDMLAAAERARDPKIGKLAKKLGTILGKQSAKRAKSDTTTVKVLRIDAARVVGDHALTDDDARTLGSLAHRRAPVWGRSHEEDDAAIAVGKAVETFKPPPWRMGYWGGADEKGYRFRWSKKQLFLAVPGQPYVAMTFASVPKSVALVPPWLAIELAQGRFLAAAIDDLAQARELVVDGRTFLQQTKKLARPGAPPKLVMLFDTLVAHGLMAAMDPLARDALLLRLFEDATKVKKSSFAELVVGRSPRVVSHDTHWFEENDGIIEAFDAALEGEPVRFTCESVVRDVAKIAIRSPDGERSAQLEPLVWEVAELLDRELAAPSAGRRGGDRHRKERRPEAPISVGARRSNLSLVSRLSPC
jgi:hypothetical protein